MQKTVHIIGAGISGLSAAVRLANAGYIVSFFEATLYGVEEIVLSEDIGQNPKK